MKSNAQLQDGGAIASKDLLGGMSEALAMHRSGHLSNRAKKDNDRRLARACFGSETVTREMITGTAPKRSLKEQANDLRNIARLANKSQAKKLLKQADELELSGNSG